MRTKYFGPGPQMDLLCRAVHKISALMLKRPWIGRGQAVDNFTALHNNLGRYVDRPWKTFAKLTKLAMS